MLNEIFGDLFKQEADAICIPTNGVVKKDGSLVMGGGVAKLARDRFRGLDEIFGRRVKYRGNHVHLATEEFDPDHHILQGKAGRYDIPYHIVGFPTKHHWQGKSDIDLVWKSAEELSFFVQAYHWNSVILPRPGCGLGGLEWESEVRPCLEEVFTLYKVIHNIKVIDKQKEEQSLDSS